MPNNNYDEMQKRMKAAFALVNPERMGAHWKAPIDAIVDDVELFRAKVILPDVVDAVEFFTGTKAKVTKVPGCPGAGPGCLWHVTAPGYWAGPCN